MERDESVVVAVQECAAGNEQVGDMWLETRIFPAETSAADILAWAGGLPSSGGRLIITHPAADEPDNEPP